MYKNLSKINKEKNLTSLKRKIILCFLIRHVANDDTSFDYGKPKLSWLSFTTNKKQFYQTNNIAYSYFLEYDLNLKVWTSLHITDKKAVIKFHQIFLWLVMKSKLEFYSKKSGLYFANGVQ